MFYTRLLHTFGLGYTVTPTTRLVPVFTLFTHTFRYGLLHTRLHHTRFTLAPVCPHTQVALHTHTRTAHTHTLTHFGYTHYGLVCLFCTHVWLRYYGYTVVTVAVVGHVYGLVPVALPRTRLVGLILVTHAHTRLPLVTRTRYVDFGLHTFGRFITPRLICTRLDYHTFWFGHVTHTVTHTVTRDTRGFGLGLHTVYTVPTHVGLVYAHTHTRCYTRLGYV